MSLMEMFIKWVLQYIIGIQNYSIRSINLTYVVSGDPDGPVSLFWKTVNLTRGSMNTINVNHYKWKPVPRFVDVRGVSINYWYDGKTFTHIPKDFDISWPPSKRPMQFSMPIKHAVILDENDKHVLDVTDIVKKLAGPKNDISVFRRFNKLVVTDLVGHSSTFVAK